MKQYAGIFIGISFAIAFGVFAPAIFAGSSDNVSGWAWSENIGISLPCN